jgi:membrane protein YdbS with pleckstrin-like domain
MFFLNKSKNSFEGQLPEEKVVLLTRKHWLNLFIPLAFIKVLIILVLGIYFIINSFGWYERISSLYWFLVSLFLLISWTLAFYNIMIYELNTVTVTNKRIIQNKQEGLFKHTINELSLTRIQDITVQVFGPVAEFLRFGELRMQSAGAKKKFIFENLPDPRKIKDIIIKEKKKIKVVC